VSHEVVMQLLGVTTTRAGLTVKAKLDKSNIRPTWRCRLKRWSPWTS